MAHIVSPEELSTEAVSLGRPVYWVGKREGEELELLRTPEGSVFVRYLVDGAEAGDDRPDFLTIGTYPVRNAYAILREQAKEPGSLMREIGGGIVTGDQANPTSIYLAYPGEGYQVEVYDPRPGRALQLALSGQVVPVR